RPVRRRTVVGRRLAGAVRAARTFRSVLMPAGTGRVASARCNAAGRDCAGIVRARPPQVAAGREPAGAVRAAPAGTADDYLVIVAYSCSYRFTSSRPSSPAPWM